MPEWQRLKPAGRAPGREDKGRSGKAARLPVAIPPKHRGILRRARPHGTLGTALGSAPWGKRCGDTAI